MQVGEKIRLARVSKGITQENLAQRSDFQGIQSLTMRPVNESHVLMI